MLGVLGNCIDFDFVEWNFVNLCIINNWEWNSNCWWVLRRMLLFCCFCSSFCACVLGRIISVVPSSSEECYYRVKISHTKKDWTLINFRIAIYHFPQLVNPSIFQRLFHFHAFYLHFLASQKMNYMSVNITLFVIFIRFRGRCGIQKRFGVF